MAVKPVMVARVFSTIAFAAATFAVLMVADPRGSAMAINEGGVEAAAIWRSIFARPDAVVAGELEIKRRDLGAMLFADPRLSGAGDRACATCHQRAHGFSDGLPTARGRDGKALKRNTPHLYNLADARSFYWDGREPTLESQARVPLHAANEIGIDLARTVNALSRDEATRDRFAKAFPGKDISEDVLVAALAAYERGLVSPVTAFDRWVSGDEGALRDVEKQGFRIFVGKGGCVSCHGGWRMTDDGFHDIGLPGEDPGRSAITGGTPGIPAFKTPGLRQVSKTAPYMHNGSLPTLDDVVAHYAGGHLQRPSLAPNLVRNLELTPPEQAALVAFLKTL